MSYDINILYYIDMFKKSRKNLIVVLCITLLLTLCFSAMKPTTYSSSVTILLSASGAGGSASTGTLGRILGISSFGDSSSTDIIVAILKSKRMATDIRKKFDLDKNPKMWWQIDADEIRGGLSISVTGPDPAVTEKIANFSVSNLNKINEELNVTMRKPMVNILDPASRGDKKSKQLPRKMFISGFMAFLLFNVCVFFTDYLARLKKSRNRQST